MNIIDSLLNGCLLLTSLNGEKNICDELMEKVYIETFLALRTFNFFEYARSIYKTHIASRDLDEYDKQKCDLVMFHLGIMENDSSVVRKADLYVKNNKGKIIQYGKSSLIPWLALICNFKSIFPDELSKSKNLNEFEPEITSIVPHSEAEHIKNKILKGRLEGKEILINGLINLSRSRNKADLV